MLLCSPTYVVVLLLVHLACACSQAAAAASAVDAQPAGKAKAAASKGKAGSKGKGAAAQQSAAAAVRLEDTKKLQLAGLLAVMASMALGTTQDSSGAALELQSSQAAASGSGFVTTLSLWSVRDLVDSLWEHLHDVSMQLAGFAAVAAPHANILISMRHNSLHCLEDYE